MSGKTEAGQAMKWRDTDTGQIIHPGRPRHDHGEAVSGDAMSPAADACPHTLVTLVCGCQDVRYACGYLDREHDHVACDGKPADTEDEYTRLLRVAAGIDPMRWAVADGATRRYVLAQGRVLLVRASGVGRRTWNALPDRCRAQSVILLRGAEVLGIDTTWAGWTG